MNNYYEQFGLNRSDSTQAISEQVHQLFVETQARLQANPTDQALSDRFNELQTVLSVFETEEKRRQYDAQVFTREKTPEEIRIETFETDLRTAQRYFFKENDLDLTRSAIKKAEKSYDQARDQNASFHYLRSAYYYRINEMDKAAEEVSDAIVINDQQVNYHVLRLQIYEKQYGKYSDRTVNLTKRVLDFMDNTYIKNIGGNFNSSALDYMAGWLYFDQDKGAVNQLAPSESASYVEKGRRYNRLLKQHNLKKNNRIDEYEAHLERQRKAEQERRRKEQERRKREAEAAARKRAEEERLRKQREREERIRLEKAAERKAAENKRRAEVRRHNAAIDSEKKEAVNELLAEQGEHKEANETKLRTISLLQKGLVVAPALFIESHFWPRMGLHTKPYMAPIYGLILGLIVAAAIYALKSLYEAEHDKKKTIGLGAIIAAILFYFAGSALEEMVRLYIVSIPLWVLVLLFKRSVDNNVANLNDVYAEKIAEVSAEFDKKKRGF